jgi:hypothetical protein
MSPLDILSAVTTAIKVAQMAIEAGKSAAPIITAIYNRITNKPLADVKQDDLDALALVSDQMTEDLMRPLDQD